MSGTLIDLSHRLLQGQPYFPTHAQYFRMPWNRLEDGDHSAHGQLVMGEHAGTHVDAPRHFYTQGSTIDQWPLERFMGPGVVVDLSLRQSQGQTSRQDLERAIGISRDSLVQRIVLLAYGWDQFWHPGPKRHEYTRTWPGLSEEAAQWLVERGVKAVGTDGVSIDADGVSESPAHHCLLGAGVPVYENLTHLPLLFGQTFDFIGVPLAIVGGTGSPVRCYARVRGEAGM